MREAVAEGTELGRRVEDVLASGELVPDDDVLELIRRSVSAIRAEAGASGWIMDGFPRTIRQAEALDALLGDAGETVDFVAVLDVDREALIGRLTARRWCPRCKKVYHLVVNPPGVEETCDRCGTKIVQREDDKPKTIVNRLDVYENQTKPILDYYEGRVPVHHVNGMLPVDEVTEVIEGLLQ